MEIIPVSNETNPEEASQNNPPQQKDTTESNSKPVAEKPKDSSKDNQQIYNESLDNLSDLMNANVTPCIKCHKIPDEFISLNCEHNFCLSCLAYIYIHAKEKQVQKEGEPKSDEIKSIIINCEICGAPTELEPFLFKFLVKMDFSQSIEALEQEIFEILLMLKNNSEFRGQKNKMASYFQGDAIQEESNESMYTEKEKGEEINSSNNVNTTDILQKDFLEQQDEVNIELKQDNENIEEQKIESEQVLLAEKENIKKEKNFQKEKSMPKIEQIMQEKPIQPQQQQNIKQQMNLYSEEQLEKQIEKTIESKIEMTLKSAILKLMEQSKFEGKIEENLEKKFESKLDDVQFLFLLMIVVIIKSELIFNKQNK